MMGVWDPLFCVGLVEIKSLKRIGCVDFFEPFFENLQFLDV